MRLGRPFIASLVVLLVVPALLPGAAATPIVIDTFGGGVQEATLDFTQGAVNDSLYLEIPPGADVLSAEVTLEGVPGMASPGSVLNFTNGKVGTAVWAHWNEGRGLWPPTVDPFTNRWFKAQDKEVDKIKVEDEDHWRTDTEDAQAGSPPGSWPMQLYRFKLVTTGAVNVTVSWEGWTNTAFNKTNKQHAEMWLYNHTDKEWIMVTRYGLVDDNITDVWMNHTFDLPSPFIASNGTLAVIVAGIHSEWAGPMLPAYDEGHLATDYIEVKVSSPGGLRYPSDVGFFVDDEEVVTLMGDLTTTITVDDGFGFTTALQAALDEYPVTPDVVQVVCSFRQMGSSVGKLNVSDLRVEYEPVVNEAPAYIGPESVSMPEDAGWTAVMNLDAAFDDDHNGGALEFTDVELVDPPFESPPYPVDLRVTVDTTGNRTLEVHADPDFFTVEPLNVSVTATDLFNVSTPGVFQLVVDQRPDRPVLVDEPNLEAFERTRFNHTVQVTDPDLPDDVMTFTDDSPHFDIDPATGQIEWTPASDQIGQHEVLVTVTDRFDLTDTILITITVQNSNDPPSITSSLEMDGRQGEEASYIIRANDPDIPFGDVLQYFAFADAIAFDIDPDTGRITFTPSNDHVPSFEIIIRVQDQIGELDERVLVVHVENVNDPPKFAEIGTITRDQNAPVSFVLQASDPDLGLAIPETETLTFSGVGPEDLLPEADGTISFTAGQSMVGEHQVTYTVTDRSGLSDVITVTWVIVDVNDVPTIITDVRSTEEALEDAEFVLALEAADPDGDPITWSDDSDLFDIGGVDGVITFTPVQADVGTHTVTVIASDDRGGETWLTFDLTVTNVNDDPVLGQVGPRSGSAFEDGEAIEFTASATDEDGDELTYVWRVGNDVIGTGPTISYDGLGPGGHTVTLEVSDANGGLATHTLRVEVASSMLSSMLLPLALLVAVIVIVGAVLYLRSRGRVEETSTGTTGDEGPTEEPVERASYDLGSSVALDYETLDVPIPPSEESVREGLDEDEIYKLEEAKEFRVGDPGDGAEEPHEE